MTRTKTTILSIVILILIAAGVTVFYQRHRATSDVGYVTYFKYDEKDKQALDKLESNEEMTVDSLTDWDAIVFSLVKEHRLGDAPAGLVYAYLYTAQRDAAFLSYQIKGRFMGTLDATSAKVLCLLFPKNCARLTSTSHSDAYSNLLADIVASKVKARMERDEKGRHPYPEPTTVGSWAGVKPYFGNDAGSWATWLITSGSEFVAPPPPANDSPEWQKQVTLTKTALANITPYQTTSVVFWAGNPGTITPPGIWLTFANDYMISHHVPFPRMVFIRSVLAMGIIDSVIAVYNSKYTYWKKRPFMWDPSIKTVMPTPNHPGYPAGHSAISGAASTILIYYFPENKQFWTEKANEASIGRVWGGIHLTIDAEQGLILGEKVGDKAIQEGNKQHEN